MLYGGQCNINMLKKERSLLHCLCCWRKHFFSRWDSGRKKLQAFGCFILSIREKGHLKNRWGQPEAGDGLGKLLILRLRCKIMNSVVWEAQASLRPHLAISFQRCWRPWGASPPRDGKTDFSLLKNSLQSWFCDMRGESVQTDASWINQCLYN